jgi:GDP-4-dehydro-6-deoxy-D-mannose reductase
LKFFITGATGFVGCHLRDFLRSSEHKIWGTTFPEKPDVSSKDTLFYLDIRSERDVFGALEEVQPDGVFHLAAVSNVRHSWERRKETLETNIIGTLNLFEAIRRNSPRSRIIFISSSDVYGKGSPSREPLNEGEQLLAMNPYAYTKWSGEILSGFYSCVEKLDIVIARPFPHTGPGQSPDFVCSDWAHQIACIEKRIVAPEIMVGNISVHRDFSDVRDVVRAYAQLMEKGRKGEVYNVCSGKSYSLEKILETLISFSATPVTVSVDSRKIRKVDIPDLVGDNRKIRHETSWEPQIPLDRSLNDLLEYWRARV